MGKAPSPLTASPAAQLDFSRSTGPVATQFDDIYYSVENGLQETQSVYLAGCKMPDIWAGRESFTVAELGFGSGLNFLALQRMWQARRPSPTARLNVISIEAYPLSREALRQALSPWTELRDISEALIRQWPGRVKGRHILEFDHGVTLTLCHNFASAALSEIQFKADSWFLDGFSPAKNPKMWSAELMRKVFDHSAPSARIGTFTVAGSVVRALKAAGFETAKREGFGRKRHRLEAVKPGTSEKLERPLSPVIIGAGIAGASLARSFLRRGITPVLIDPGLGDGASFNPLAIVKPRLDLQDRPESRFFLAAYLYAQSLYEGPALSGRGAGSLAQSEDMAMRFDKLAEQSALPAQHMRRVDAKTFEGLTGVSSEYGGLWFESAPRLRPELLISDWLKDVIRVQGKASFIRDGKVCDEGGTVLAQGSDVFITAGFGAIKLADAFDPALPLTPVRGQIDWNISGGGLRGGVSYGGYASAYGDGILVGATHERECSDAAARAQDTLKNLDGFAKISGKRPKLDMARASIRVGTSKGLPISRTLSRGVHIITALAGRGFSHAPLLAENRVRHICGEFSANW